MSSRQTPLKYPPPRHEPLRRLREERSEMLECLRATGGDCYVDASAPFGSTTTDLVLRRRLPFPAGVLVLVRASVSDLPGPRRPGR